MFSITARMNDRIPIGTMTGALVATVDSGIGKAPRRMPRYITLEIVRRQRTQSGINQGIRGSAIGGDVITREGDYSETAGKSE